MAELEDPQQELACQKRADGLSQKAAYAASGYADGKNGPRFFRQKQVAKRVREIVARRAVLADLDDAWVLARLKRIADVNLDDYYAHNDKGDRFSIEVDWRTPRRKLRFKLRNAVGPGIVVLRDPAAGFPMVIEVDQGWR